MWIPFHRLDRPQIRFVGAMGRALVLAQNFEENCRFVYMTAAVVAKLKSREFVSLEQSFPFAEALNRLMLGPTLKNFRALGVVRQEETATVGAAKDARNYIAHESGFVVLSAAVGPRFQVGRNAFEGRVRTLAAGDALVSKWSYMIQEKEAPPAYWALGYPDAVTRWVVSGSQKPPMVEIATRGTRP